MKRVFRLSIVCILSLLIVLSSVACAKKSDSLGYADTTPMLPAYTDGVHNFDVVPFEDVTEEDYIVRNGEFQYKVITSDTITTVESEAKTEFGSGGGRSDR